MTKTILQIDGMACGMCEAHINDAIRQNFSVKKVTSSFKKKQTEILSENPLDEEKLCSVIRETGYTPVSVSSAPCEKRRLFGF